MSQVVRIRLSPMDCMAVADVCEAIGVHEPGMSFSHATSVALASLLQSAREAGAIPVRDGFDYKEVMARYDDKARTAKKLGIANRLSIARPHEPPRDTAEPIVRAHTDPLPRVPALSAQPLKVNPRKDPYFPLGVWDRLERRRIELGQKFEINEANFDKLDEAELEAVLAMQTKEIPIDLKLLRS